MRLFSLEDPHQLVLLNGAPPVGRNINKNIPRFRIYCLRSWRGTGQVETCAATCLAGENEIILPVSRTRFFFIYLAVDVERFYGRLA